MQRRQSSPKKTKLVGYLHTDPPDNTAFQTRGPSNVSVNGFPFQPAPRRAPQPAPIMGTGMGNPYEDLYQSPFASVGYKDNGVIDTLLGPVRDLQKRLPPAQGVYRQNKNDKHLNILQGSFKQTTMHKQDTNLKAIGDTDTLLLTIEKQNRDNASSRNQLENKYHLHGYAPSRTGIREAPYGVKTRGGQYLQRFNPRVAPTNRVFNDNERVFNNNTVDVAGAIKKDSARKCHNGEVKTDFLGANDGILRQSMFNHDDVPLGADVEEVHVDPRNAELDARAIAVDRTTPRTNAFSETSLQHHVVNVEVLNGISSANEHSDSLVAPEVKGLRYGNMNILKRNPLYNKHIRYRNKETKIQDNVTYQSDNHQSMVQTIGVRAYDKSLRIQREEPTQFTDVNNSSLPTRSQSSKDTFSTEQSFTRANPLFDAQHASNVAMEDHGILDEVAVETHPQGQGGMGGAYFPSGRLSSDQESLNC